MIRLGIPPLRSAPAAGGRDLAAYAEKGLLCVLALWALVPIVLISLHALIHHYRLTGADGVIGADQLQYLAWARDAGGHGLASNLFDLAPSGHVFVQPMFTISGLLWRLGLTLTAAYWLWKPVAIAVLFWGVWSFARRMFPSARAPRVAVLVLALFMLTPIASLVAWVSIGSSTWRQGVLTSGAEMLPAGMLWGYLPSAIATGLMALALLQVEQVLDRRRPIKHVTIRAGERSSSTRSAWLSRPAVMAALAGAAVSWLHPWQGVTLLLIMVGLGAWERRRDLWLLALPAVATALPLAYYILLSRLDSGWRLASHNEIVSRPSIGALVAVLGPLVLLAGAGVRDPGQDRMERAVLLWLPASLIAYAAVNSFSTHALQALSLPLAALAVRGWRRLRLPTPLALATIALITLPGMAYEAKSFFDVARGPAQEYYLTHSEARALRFVASKAAAGGVLGPPLFAIAIPSQTGRPVWVGHEFWSEDYTARVAVADALFGGSLTPTQARDVVLGSGARLVVSDCAHRLDLQRVLPTILGEVHRDGCAAVYVVRAPKDPR